MNIPLSITRQSSSSMLEAWQNMTLNHQRMAEKDPPVEIPTPAPKPEVPAKPEPAPKPEIYPEILPPSQKPEIPPPPAPLPGSFLRFYA